MIKKKLMQSQHKIDINHNYRKVKKIKFGRYLKKNSKIV